MLGGVVVPALPSPPRTWVAAIAAAHRSASSALNSAGLLFTWARCMGAWVGVMRRGRWEVWVWVEGRTTCWAWNQGAWRQDGGHGGCHDEKTGPSCLLPIARYKPGAATLMRGFKAGVWI